MEDIHYDNQKIFCEKASVPLFAYKVCSHTYPWMSNSSSYGKRQTLTEMLIDKYGEEEAFLVSSGTHITGCPICGRSWCD